MIVNGITYYSGPFPLIPGKNRTPTHCVHPDGRREDFSGYRKLAESVLVTEEPKGECYWWTGEMWPKDAWRVWRP